MSLLRHSRARLLAFWILFAVATVATAAAVFGLYRLVSAEIEEQSRRAVAQESERARERERAFTDDARRSTIAELAGFHADGLGRALRRWDEANAVVAATFEWDPVRGFLRSSTISATDSAAAALPALWETFGTWRREHPSATICDLDVVDRWRTQHLRTTENPAFAARDLGYQAENLDVLAYAGRRVDPWAGWAASLDNPAAPWVLWYRAGPDEPVRGCFVDVGPLLAELQAGFVDTQLVRIELGPRPAAGGAAGGGGAALEGFPAHRLEVAAGVVFSEKQSRVLFFSVTVALLLGVFVLGAGFLATYSRREVRDAERKSTFVSQVSHELRTPLTSIRMFADMLAAPALPEEKRQKFAATISRESQRLGGLIERLLTFNALEKGRVSVAIAPVDVVALARETLDDMDATLREGGLRVEAALPAVAMASTDRTAVKQALLNLLDNALKYARAGGVVRIALEDTDGLVRLRVRDRGPGIPRELRPRVFEPFVQGGGQTLTEKTPGVGLGLSIARGLLRSAGGDLVLLAAGDLAGAESGATGAVFEIRVPKLSPS